MIRSQTKRPRIDQILLVIVAVLFIIFIAKFFMATHKQRIRICIYSSSYTTGSWKSLIHVNLEKLQYDIQNMQTAKFIVITGTDPNEALNEQKLDTEFAKCNLIIIANMPAAKQFVVDALYNYVQNGGKLIVLGDSLSMRMITYQNANLTPYYQLFGMQWKRSNGMLNLPVVNTANKIRVYDPQNPLFLNCVAENGLKILPSKVTFVEVEEYGTNIDTQAAFITKEGSYPAVLSGKYGAGTVVIFTYDATQTPCILENTINYLALGNRTSFFGFQLPSKIF